MLKHYISYVIPYHLIQIKNTFLKLNGRLLIILEIVWNGSQTERNLSKNRINRLIGNPPKSYIIYIHVYTK